MIIFAVLFGSAVLGSYAWCVVELYNTFTATGGDWWLSVFVTLVSATAVALVYCFGLMLLQPVIILLAGLSEALYQLVAWIIRRIRGVSAHPLP